MIESHSPQELVETKPPIEIMIPPETRKGIQNGLISASRFFANPETRPQLVIPVDRSGRLLAPSLEAALTTNNIATEFASQGVLVNRDVSQRFPGKHPELFTQGGVMVTPTDSDLRQFSDWLPQDPQSQQVIKQLRDVLEKNPQLDKLALIDDVFQEGSTILTLAEIAKHLNREIRFQTNTGRHSQEVLDAIATQTSGEPLTISILAIARNPNWLSDIVGETFKHDLQSLQTAMPNQQEIDTAKSLVEIAKGYSKQNGSTRSLSPTDIESLPVSLKEKYSPNQLLNLSSRLTSSLQEIGSQTIFPNFNRS